MENLSWEDAIQKRNKYKNKIISVTGTSGKTTTCKFIYDILKNFSIVNKTHRNSNSFLGIPWCINKYFNINADYWIIEIGISKPNEMETLVKFINPDIRIITNIGIAHTLNFKNGINDYIKEKLEFTKNMSEDSVLIINNDDSILNNYSFTNLNIIKCGTRNNDDIQLIDYISNNTTSNVKIKYNNKIYIFKINGVGKHNALNLCFAIACATYLKIPLELIENTCTKFDLYDYRGKITINKNIYLYDHCYNCSLTSIINNLLYFKEINVENKIIILGDMEELDDSLNNHNMILSKALEITNNILIYSINTFKNILNNNFKLFEDHNFLKNYIKEIINFEKEYYIFIQGSNSSNLNLISDFIKEL